jgi:hypothetical protein
MVPRADHELVPPVHVEVLEGDEWHPAVLTAWTDTEGGWKANLLITEKPGTLRLKWVEAALVRGQGRDAEPPDG